MLECEQLPGAAKAGLDFVDDDKDAVRGADVAEVVKVGRGAGDVAAGC